MVNGRSSPFDQSVDFFDSLRKSKWGRGQLLDFIRFADPQEDMWVLDIGCGAGNLVMELSSRVAKAACVDLSSKMIERGLSKKREGEAKNIDFRVAAAEDLPYSDNFFDMVVMTSVLYLLNSALVGLREMFRVLKPRGIAAVLEPTTLMIPRRMSYYIAKKRQEGENLEQIISWAYAAQANNPFSPQLLQKLFEKAGFTDFYYETRMDDMVIYAKARKSFEV